MVMFESRAVIGGFHPPYRFLYFLRSTGCRRNLIDSSKTRKSLVGVEVRSPYVIERRSNMTGSGTNILSFCLFSGIEGAFYESGSKTVIPRKVSMQYVRLQFQFQ